MKDSIKKIIKIGSLLSLLIYTPHFLDVATGPLLGVGPWRAIGTDLIIIFLVPVGLGIALLFGIGSLFFRKNTDQGVNIIGVCLFIGLLFVPALIAANGLRSFGFLVVTQRAEPLVAAIKTYEKEKGTPPENLQDLIPTYISKIPYGLAPLKYKSQDGEWGLSADTSTGILNWDIFFYCPNRNDCIDGKEGMERIGDWIYYHE